MGGDHKCPVCQATFTRPQHVARHMRSHTGDRPYKCQYCGDQFARSDLLSRHVNKCHASEKPLPITGTRRKGSASASRATTSKQACDQCVQSSLPCDGCNPCSKCVLRKCRCTFVKFHRQTAPTGPGHAARPNATSNASASGLVPMPSASSSRIPVFPQPEDDFILGPPPPSSAASTSSVPTMAETLYNSNSFAFPPLYPEGVDTGYASKYRSQAHEELFGAGRTGLTPLYDPRAVTEASMAWEQHGGDAYHNQQQQQQQDQQRHGRHLDMIPASATGTNGTNGAPPSAAMLAVDKHIRLRPHQHSPHLHQPRPHPHFGQQQFMDMTMPYPLSGSIYGTSVAGSGTGSSHGSDGDCGSADLGAGSHNRRGSVSIDSHNNHSSNHNNDRNSNGDHDNNQNSTDLVHTDFNGAEYDYNEFNGSDDGNTDGSHPDSLPRSVPSSMASSTAQLPNVNAGSGPNPNVNSNSLPQANPLAGEIDMGVYYQPQDQRFRHEQQEGLNHDQGLYAPGFSLDLNLPDRRATASTSTTSSSSSNRNQSRHSRVPSYEAVGGPPLDERHEFSSAFGLMSLDDPAVIAGTATDGQPFFSNPGHAHNQLGNSSGRISDLNTPMPTKRGSALMQQLQSPGRGLEVSGDLPTPFRDFWKQYMRTPLTGPGPAGWLVDTHTTSSTPNANNHSGAKGLSSSTPHRRPRVASMPSSNTPVLERDYMIYPTDGEYHQKGHTQDVDKALGPMTSIRTTLHGNSEDLRSYEAAVLARKAPTVLNLKRPTKGKGITSTGTFGTRAQSAVDLVGLTSNAGPHPAAPSSSSLANALAGQQLQQQSSATRNDSASPALSRNSPAPADESDSSAPSSARPSFKRLPSQTLGPANFKKPFYGFGDENNKDRELVGWGNGGGEPATVLTNAHSMSNNSRLGGISHPDRVVASLSERRRRRMSAPSSSLSLWPLPPSLHEQR